MNNELVMITNCDTDDQLHGGQALKSLPPVTMTPKDGFVYVRNKNFVVKLEQESLKEVDRYKLNLTFSRG
jgi:hypothetical protein